MSDFGKPSEKEEEFFARREYLKRKEAAKKGSAQLQTAAREEAKKLHHMKCPKCGMELAELNFQGVSIDKCTECEGIWLDAGELETLIGHDEGVMTRALKVFGLKE